MTTATTYVCSSCGGHACEAQTAVDGVWICTACSDRPTAPAPKAKAKENWEIEFFWKDRCKQSQKLMIAAVKACDPIALREAELEHRTALTALAVYDDHISYV